LKHKQCPGIITSELKVASLEKIIRSKKTIGRPRDLAVIEILERTLDEKKKKR
jgi:hypothetical protein